MAATQQNFYRLKAACGGCSYQVRINDIRLLEDSTGGRIDTEIPLNQWLRPGRNVLSRRVVPLPGAAPDATAAQCDLRLLVRERQEEWNHRREISSFPLRSGAIPAEEQFDIEADVAFPEPTWFQSERISLDDHAILDALLARLRIMHHLVGEQQWDILLTMMRTKNHELAACQYQSFDVRERIAVEELQAFRRRIPVPLVPFQPDQARLQTSGFGRLATVITGNGQALIRAEDEHSVASMRTLFCLHKGDLIWIR